MGEELVVRHGNLFRVLVILLIVLISLGTIWQMWPPRLGLDLSGGIDVVLEAQDTEEHRVTADDMSSLRTIIETRVNRTNLAEPIIIREGANRIRVQLPEVTDREQALEIIGRTAMLSFVDPDGNTIVTGTHLASAQGVFSQYHASPVVQLTFTREGGRLFEAATERLAREPLREDRILYIYLDDEIISEPAVQYGQPIYGNEAIITGIGSMEEARTIAILLQGGSLPVPVEILSDSFVDPVLGAEAVNRSLQAGIAGIILVLIYMIAFYKFSGIIADLALGVYVLVLLSVLMSLNATLTLPGIAGLILSIGMAVDANVIIFERIKEELRSGKKLRASIDSGFKRAFTAIADANITTLITAAVLLYFGTGAVRGFAITLSVGILASMFTAMVVTRWLITVIISKDPDKYRKYFAV